MHVKNLGIMILADDVTAASNFYTSHFGFKALARLSWYASHEHPDQKGVYLDIVKTGHDSAGKALDNVRTNGIILALLSDDCDAEYERLKDKVTILMPPQSEPWGQRRCQIAAPDGVIVEVIQVTPLDEEWLKANP
jgi:uncharacterized glyoxalase superfamily protein PhnB